MADASPGQVQFLIADNQLPAHYRRDYDQIDFTYDTPPSQPSAIPVRRTSSPSPVNESSPSPVNEQNLECRGMVGYEPC
jgi:hypothetical protein